MKLKSGGYFILSGVLALVFVILVTQKIQFATWGFLGGAIGSLIRGMYEMNKENKT